MKDVDREGGRKGRVKESKQMEERLGGSKRGGRGG